MLRGNHLGNVIAGDLGDDVLIGRQGADSMSGGAGNDVLRGDGGDDVLDGGAGQDLLIGGLGTDFLTGGADADVFMFVSAAEAGLGAARDQILDFEQGVDVINLAGVVPGAFTFRGTDGFTGTGAPELQLIETAGGGTVVQFDTDGDGSADGGIRVVGVSGLTADDFIL